MTEAEAKEGMQIRATCGMWLFFASDSIDRHFVPRYSVGRIIKGPNGELLIKLRDNLEIATPHLWSDWEII